MSDASLQDRWHWVNAYWLCLSVLVIVTDQLTKQWAMIALATIPSVPVTSFFAFTLSHNTGAAFGLLHQGGQWASWLFGCLALGVSFYLLHRMLTVTNQKALLSAEALIIGGALSNCWDRWQYGAVVDFLHLHWMEWSWPIFNVADSAICVGAFLWLLFTKESW